MLPKQLMPTASKKTIILITSIVLLCVLLIVFTNPWSTLKNDARNIALKSVAEVDRIVLADAFDSTVLVRQDDTWLINDKEQAGQIPVENLLIAAERLEISSIVSSKSETGNSLVRTVTYYRGEKTVLTYELQTQGQKYLLTPTGSDQSFYVAVSGYPDLNLNKVFSSTPNHYREHLLIDLLPSEISRIEIELQGGESYFFTQNQEGEVTCIPAQDQDPIPSTELNELATRLLFSYFTSIVYEDKSGIAISTLHQTNSGSSRMARLHVESFEGENHTLEVFPYVENLGGEPHMFKALVHYNTEPEALVVNYIYLDVLMRDLSHYVGEN